jgi:glycogen(starch) synthase
MISEAIRLGVMNNFIFTGFLRGDEKNQIYQAADLYVMPSVSEPFGITALEAISNGTPVLISKQSGVSEILENALKVDFWDIDEMANKILAVLKYNPLHLDLKKESGKEIKTITWDKAADKCFNIYNQLTY